jgi:putative nucleotidyltransferase with HDIG domain
MQSSTQTPVGLPPAWREQIERHLAQDLELPLLPETAARVVGLCDGEQADARAIERVLERDPSLASALLRVANSALYAPKEPIVSLQQAVSRLGLKAVRNIALSASLQGRVFRVPGHEQRVREIWTHCALAAAFAREAARKLRRNVEGAFLCGLLHDVGRPIVLQAAIDARGPLPSPPLDAQLLEAAMDEFHERTGARLVRAWGLADWTEAAVAHHHDPERAAPHEDSARLTRLADLLARWARAAGSAPQDFPADDPVVQALNLYPEDVEELLAQRERAAAAAEALG